MLDAQADLHLCCSHTAKADLRLCCLHTAKAGFVMTWLKYKVDKKAMKTESPGDGSFPADGHQAILNKAENRNMTN